MVAIPNHTEANDRSLLKASILKLLKDRKPGASICPSDAARTVFDKDWREKMQQVLTLANEMARQNQIEICQQGIVIDPATAKGPIRLRMPENQSK